MNSKSQIINILKAGGIGVMPTDTIYGLVGQALDKKAVERIYKVRHRRPDKPFIILISSYDDLKSFGINLDQKDHEILRGIWPGQVSVILPCKSAKLKYLHRGTNSLAFRLPDKKSVLDILRQTGPLVAPSANPEGLPPANDLGEAKKYFGLISSTLTKGGERGGLDFYYGQGKMISQPSTLVKLENGKLELLRQGNIKIKTES